MRRIKRPNGEFIYVVKDTHTAPEGMIWFTATQWRHVEALLAGQVEPKDKKEFLDGICERKKENPFWNIFSDFPLYLKENPGKLSKISDICNSQAQRLRYS